MSNADAMNATLGVARSMNRSSPEEHGMRQDELIDLAGLEDVRLVRLVRD